MDYDVRIYATTYGNKLAFTSVYLSMLVLFQHCFFLGVLKNESQLE